MTTPPGRWTAGRDQGVRRGPVARRRGLVVRGAGVRQAVGLRGGPHRLARRGPDAGRRDLPRGRRARGARAGHRGDRGGRGLHLVRLQVGRPQARAGRRRLFPAVLDRRHPEPGQRPGTGVPRPVGQADRGASSRRDFTPLAIGIGEKLEAVPIVFAGYGITAKDEARKLDYDDYAGIDVKGKAVLIIRREPQDEDDEESRSTARTTSRFATFQHKATNAFQHGAAAVLLVNDRLARQGSRRIELLKFEDAGTQPYLQHPVRDAHPRVRRQACWPPPASPRWRSSRSRSTRT